MWITKSHRSAPQNRFAEKSAESDNPQVPDYAILGCRMKKSSGAE
jgi:hypothetical protein